jgi:hypothetical protein
VAQLIHIEGQGISSSPSRNKSNDKLLTSEGPASVMLNCSAVSEWDEAGLVFSHLQTAQPFNHLLIFGVRLSVRPSPTVSRLISPFLLPQDRSNVSTHASHLAQYLSIIGYVTTMLRAL